MNYRSHKGRRIGESQKTPLFFGHETDAACPAFSITLASQARSADQIVPPLFWDELYRPGRYHGIGSDGAGERDRCGTRPTLYVRSACQQLDRG